MAVRKLSKLPSRPQASAKDLAVEALVEVGGLAGSEPIDVRAKKELFRAAARLALSKPSSGVNPRTALEAIKMLSDRIIGPVIVTTANLNLNQDVPHVPIDLGSPANRRAVEDVTRAVAGLLGVSGDPRDVVQPGQVETVRAPRAPK